MIQMTQVGESLIPARSGAFDSESAGAIMIATLPGSLGRGAGRPGEARPGRDPSHTPVSESSRRPGRTRTSRLPVFIISADHNAPSLSRRIMMVSEQSRCLSFRAAARPGRSRGPCQWRRRPGLRVGPDPSPGPGSHGHSPEPAPPPAGPGRAAAASGMRHCQAS